MLNLYLWQFTVASEGDLVSESSEAKKFEHHCLGMLEVVAQVCNSYKLVLSHCRYPCLLFMNLP